MSFLKHAAKSFETNGTEGMLDVILGCTLVFILLSSLIQVGQAQAQEKTLPAMNLSKTSSQQAGSTQIKKTNISIKKVNSKMKLYLDSQVITPGDLKNRLQNLKGIGQVALRRDKDIPCAWEDKIIIICQESGIDRVSIVVGVNNK
ncbi:MAG: biopolymer transporter ExbD [Victivallales bacterium]|nr:biopolymer transporter ExbD [Victivallales bacterium]